MTPKEVLTAFHAAFVARDVDGLCALCPHMSLAACSSTRQGLVRAQARHPSRACPACAY